MKRNPKFLKWIAGKPDGVAMLATTDVDPDDFTYSEYLDWCEANGQKPADESSDEFQFWRYETAGDMFSEDISNLLASGYLQGPVVITGTVGRWNGRFDIPPEICSTFKEAYRKCSSEMLDVDVDYDTRCIHIAGHHHDATNYFDVLILRDGADTDLLQRRIDAGSFDPSGVYDRRFFQKITDYLV